MNPIEILNDPIYQKILENIVQDNFYSKVIFGDMLFFQHVSDKPGLILVWVGLYRPCDEMWVLKKYYGYEDSDLNRESSELVYSLKNKIINEMNLRTKAKLASTPNGSIVVDSFEVDLDSQILDLVQNGFPKPELKLEDYGYCRY